ncbi:sensor histidine kinase [Natrarchaeobaculum aegyptiacum]|uniref:sensor histidine kinase n=1 Tax=Natrarchaeobaculum aegyptiacum TaxID=745377 RepID=UPI001374772F|nr:HAMP domain-containing sensor histidine kinase [Natrarchaeobaculum aegyptiacum]
MSNTGGSADTAATVQLLVDDDANREALQTILERRYVVTTDASELSGDLVLVDDRSFASSRDVIETPDDEDRLEFTPVVLLRRAGTRLDESLLTTGPSGERPLIDEVVDAPVQPTILFRRLDNLITRRRQFELLQNQNEQLEAFADVVSHDLRNPLQIATGRLELLESSVPTDEQVHVEEIQTSLERMEKIVESMLTLAQRGNDTGALTPVSVGDVADDAWAVIDAPDATFVNSAAETTILADEDQLQTIFENLFRNAVEHGTAGESAGSETEGTLTGAIEIAVSGIEDGFVVEDDGAGIPPEKRERVLERGYSGGDGGTGLGLDIVLTVVEAHGWDITLEESDAGGTQFLVTGVTRVE